MLEILSIGSVNEISSVDRNYYVPGKRRFPAVGGKRVVIPSQIRSSRRSKILNNSWIVPYKQKFTGRPACFFNVQLFKSGKAGIEFCFKYFCKSYDWIFVEKIGDSGRQWHHEIRHLQDEWYVSAREVLWHFYRSDIVNGSSLFEFSDVENEKHQSCILGRG